MPGPSQIRTVGAALSAGWRLAAGLLLPVCALAAPPEATLSLGWDSAYVSEGRDNLERGGLVSGAFDLSWSTVSLWGWVARGDTVGYREYNLGIATTWSFRGVEAVAGYTRLGFDGVGEAPGDNELSLQLALPAPAGCEATVGGRYSTRADGTFLEASIRRAWRVGEAGLEVAPYLMLGIDFGYATAEYNGLNHLEGGVQVDCPLSDRLTLRLHASHGRALGDVRRDGGANLTWGGAHLFVRF